MSQVVSISTRKVYGLSRVCRIWRRCRSSVYWHRAQNNEAKEPRRRGPQGPCSDVELIQKIREVLQQSPFHGEGYRKVWAKLRYKGIRTSRRRVLRLMRQEGLLAFQRLGNPRGSKAHEGTILKEEPDQMWGTDMTSTWTGQGQACLFVAVDHCTCECIGIHASRSGNRWQALEPLRQGVRCYLGGFAAAVAPGLEIRHDHGSAYLSDDFQSEIAFWGMESSPAFVREPEGNGCAERFIRTLKENLLWTRSFDTIDELREALLEFRDRYNQEWIIERHSYRTPNQVRRDWEAMKQSAA